MEEIVTVKLSMDEVKDAITQYLRKSGYNVKDNSFKFDKNLATLKVSGIAVEVLNTVNR